MSLANDQVPMGDAPTHLRPGPTVIGTAAKRTRRQRAAAEVITADARCTPVLVRAVIIGKARMPRAALDITTPSGESLGHVALPNTSASFDPEQRWWLVGDPTPGSIVALVSVGRTQVLLPGGRLHAGPAVEQEWSGIACRMLGWQRPDPGAAAPEAWQAVFSQRAPVNNPDFLKAVDRFRMAAVNLPLVFFAFCFPFLFVIPAAVEAGFNTFGLLVLPVLGGGIMTLWSARARQKLGEEAQRIEDDAARWGKEIAFTQSYWAGMRKPATVWDGPLPEAAR